MADMFSAITAIPLRIDSVARAVIFRFSRCLALNKSITQTRGIMGLGGPMQIVLRYPTVTCPGCKRPMTPSPPQPVSVDTDLCDVIYTCKNCAATTTRTIKIELGGARAH